MTTYIAGTGTVNGVNAQVAMVFEQRVTNTLLSSPNQEIGKTPLYQLRNDEAFGAGITTNPFPNVTPD